MQTSITSVGYRVGPSDFHCRRKGYLYHHHHIIDGLLGCQSFRASMHHHHCEKLHCQTKDWNRSALQSITDLQYSYCSSSCVPAVSTNVTAQVVSAVNTVQYLNLFRQAIIEVEGIVADGAAHSKGLLDVRP